VLKGQLPAPNVFASNVESAFADGSLQILPGTHRGFYTNLVRSTFAGNGVTAAGSLFARFSHKALLFLPFGNHGVGALGDVVFNSCWVFAVICLATMLWQAALSKQRRSHIP
jgi:hypothetical protein